MVIAIGYIAMRVGLAPTPGVTVENYERVYKGMRVADVEALFAVAPESNTLTFVDGDHKYWTGNNLDIVIRFKDARAISGFCFRRPERGIEAVHSDLVGTGFLFDSLMAWLGLK